MRVREIVYNPETDERHVFSRSIPVSLITGFGISLLNHNEGRIFLKKNGLKIITVESMPELARMYLNELEV